MEKYDVMTTQELEEILRNEETDAETVLYILDLLAERQGTSGDNTAQEAWELFNREYLPSKDPLLLNEKKSGRKLWRTLGYMAASFVLLVTVFSAVFMHVEAFRIAVINFVIENTQGHWHITGEAKLPEDNVYQFNTDDPLGGLIAEDFVLKDISIVDPGMITASYENSKGGFANFLSMPITASLSIDSENADVSKEVRIGNCGGVLVVKNGVAQAAWWDKEAGMMYLVILSGSTEKEIHALAEQLEKMIGG